jgi:hypothetical protein
MSVILTTRSIFKLDDVKTHENKNESKDKETRLTYKTCRNLPTIMIWSLTFNFDGIFSV